MKRFAALALTLVALQPIAASAQLAPVPQAQEYLNYLNASSAVVSTGLSSPVMVGPYQGRFEDAAGSATSNNFALYCVDYYHYANNSDGLVNAWGVDGSLGDVSTTRFRDVASYRKAAFLASLFETTPAAQRQSTWSALHAAIWQTTTGEPVATGLSAQAAAYFNMAVPDDFTGEGWYVLSSVELAGDGYPNRGYDGTGQEFLVRTQSVPEPGTVLLMLSGLLLMVGANRRRLAEIY